MEQHESAKPDPARRQFLLAARGAGVLGAIAVLFGKGGTTQAAPLAPAPDSEPAGRGYRETEHIRKYYRSARYW